MSSSEKYEIWFSLTVEHEYYGTENCPVQLHISHETKFLFKQYRILCRRMKVNQWAFLTQSLEIEDEHTSNLYFELIPEDKILYYITDIQEDNVKGQNYELKRSSEINKWIELIIPIERDMRDINISFNSKSKYLEYIVVNKNQKDNIQLKIEEKQKRINFGKLEILEDLSLGKGFRIISNEKIKLKKAYENYMLQLFELKSNGERILCNNLPFPQPTETSISSPYDTITTYYYI